MADAFSATATDMKPNGTGIGCVLHLIPSQTETSDVPTAMRATALVESEEIIRIRTRERRRGRFHRLRLYHHNRRREPENRPRPCCLVKCSVPHPLPALAWQKPIVGDDLQIRIRCNCLSRHIEMKLRFEHTFLISHISSLSLVLQLGVLFPNKMI